MTSRPTTRNLQLSPLRRPPPSPSPPRSAVILATQPWSSFYSHARSLSFFFCCSFSIPLELCGFHSSVWFKVNGFHVRLVLILRLISSRSMLERFFCLLINSMQEVLPQSPRAC
ncbi:uncharacterized protein LOC130985584 isoform X4 [Salvia miltiorrhiza]|uniref:uncharacterized protein LOC130985584 isoform X4 n=1 Tax=Salvia miltiorrhiza TaxID=226208 RepID=UPI0025ACB659|nr:uncharacterized protein LOC130985584 isoform X4 [Salvia miltiorrhiza]XP_057764621.1 uncharacterized protein LOC130985584 isoform X4 [Salvia miltiorrhiza]